jgi:O-antigen/teichoic acid export membrane protein
MTDFRSILRHGGWNLVGTALPLAAAIGAVPYLLSQIGVERFGILSLVWVLIGYFSFFDLGIGRALTKLVAERVDDQCRGELVSLCSTGTALVVVVGLCGSIMIGLLACFPELWLMRLPVALHSESVTTLALVAITVPAVVGTAALRGILEGYQAFKALNLIRVPAGIAMFLAPCVTAVFSPRLDLAVAALAVTRVFFLLVHATATRKLCPLSLRAVDRRWLRPLLDFGGWSTVSSTVGPVIIHLDRFVIGALLPPAAVGYYAAPFEVVSRMLILPMALCSAIFPALARSNRNDQGQSAALQKKAFWLIVAVVLPISALGAVLAQPLLYLWLGADFAREGALAMQILFAGFALNAVSQLPFATLHSMGRTRDTALVHLIELPLYVIVLVWSVTAFGLPGAAAAWSLRALVDTVALMWLLNSARPAAWADFTSQTGDARLR